MRLFRRTLRRGNAFKLTPDGQMTIFYNFCSPEQCADGIESLRRLHPGSRRKLLWIHLVWRA